MEKRVEKEFFEKFNIPKYFSMEVNFGDLDCNFQTVIAKSLNELWDNYEFDLSCSEYWFEEGEKAPKTYQEFKKSDYWREEYPEITADILLELIGFLNVTYNTYKSAGYSPFALKIEILKQIINAQKDEKWIYEKVRELFELKEE